MEEKEVNVDFDFVKRIHCSRSGKYISVYLHLVQ